MFVWGSHSAVLKDYLLALHRGITLQAPETIWEVVYRTWFTMDEANVLLTVLSLHLPCEFFPLWYQGLDSNPNTYRVSDLPLELHP